MAPVSVAAGRSSQLEDYKYATFVRESLESLRPFNEGEGRGGYFDCFGIDGWKGWQRVDLRRRRGRLLVQFVCAQRGLEIYTYFVFENRILIGTAVSCIIKSIITCYLI